MHQRFLWELSFGRTNVTELPSGTFFPLDGKKRPSCDLTIELTDDKTRPTNLNEEEEEGYLGSTSHFPEKGKT